MNISKSFGNFDRKLFELNREDILKFNGTSKGNQAKWNLDDYWIKRDYLGYESLAEVISSKFLECIEDVDFVRYDFCDIKYNNVIYSDACCSKNFLSTNDSLITVGRLLNIDSAFMKRLLKMECSDRVKFVLDLIEEKTGFDSTDYMGTQMFLDSIIKNEDRHFFNLALVENEYGEFSGCPIFDNGGSLLSDCKMYSMEAPLFVNLRNVKSKPFMSSFNKQANLFRDLNVKPLKINLDQLNEDLGRIEYSSTHELTRALHVLKLGLKEMEGLTWEKI